MTRQNERPTPQAPTPVTCVGCGQTVTRLLYVGTDYLSQRSFDVLICDHCRLIQTDATAEAASTSYNDYYGKRQGSFEPIINRLRRRRLLRALGASGVGAILDVGCGRGGFLAAMRDAGWHVAGVERVVPDYEELWHRERLDVRTGEWGRVECPAQAFDVVTFWHVFEHLASPHTALEHASRALKPNGTLVIAVPDIGGVQARLFGRRWFHLDVPRHLVHYTIESLGDLLDQHGFALTQAHHYSAEYDTFGAVQSALNVCCRTQNLLFDLIMRRRSAKSILAEASPRAIADLALTAVLALPLTLIALPFCWLTSWARRGATVEVYAHKVKP